MRDVLLYFRKCYDEGSLPPDEPVWTRDAIRESLEPLINKTGPGGLFEEWAQVAPEAEYRFFLLETSDQKSMANRALRRLHIFERAAQWPKVSAALGVVATAMCTWNSYSATQGGNMIVPEGTKPAIFWGLFTFAALKVGVIYPLKELPKRSERRERERGLYKKFFGDGDPFALPEIE